MRWCGCWAAAKNSLEHEAHLSSPWPTRGAKLFPPVAQDTLKEAFELFLHGFLQQQSLARVLKLGDSTHTPFLGRAAVVLYFVAIFASLLLSFVRRVCVCSIFRYSVCASRDQFAKMEGFRSLLQLRSRPSDVIA